ncbi:MAG: molybdopterin-dependent oxidoreductase [Methyloligellaceae bacterium]
MKRKFNIPGVDGDMLVKDAVRLMTPLSRRAFLRGTGSLGALVLLTGCEVVDGASANNLLRAVSRFNDGVQAVLFNPSRLAPVFKESDITRPFPFNAFYPEEDAPEVDVAEWRLTLGGRIADKRPWTLEQLGALPQDTQITQHICIEGWSAIGKWTGPPLADFLKRIGADPTAKYVGFRCEDRYATSLDMASALHPQTQMTLAFDGGTLPRRYGFPLKVRVPTKLGFKNPKHVYELFVTNDYPGGFWENQGYNWFSGL